MKKLLLGFILCTGFLSAQNQAIDSTKYDYIGYAIDSTLYSGDKKYINDLFDIEEFVTIFLKKTDDKEITKMNKQFVNGFKSGFDYGGILITQIGDSGSYDFIKSYVDENQKYHLVYRLFSDEGMNYHDYELRTEASGKVMIQDIYLYLSGENLSTSIGNVYEAAMASQKKNFFGMKSNTFVRDMAKIERSKKLRLEGKSKEAYKIYQTVSKESKKNKMVKLAGINIAYGLEDESILKKMIADYEQAFPNDPSLYLISLDGAYLREDYDEVARLIENLDKSIGGDDFLDLYRANLAYTKGNREEALKYIDQLLENYPTYVDGFTFKMALLIELDRKSEVISLLDYFTDVFGVDKETMEDAVKTDFPEFAKTKEFLDWNKKK